MPVQASPELVVNGEIPGDGFGISERRLLPLVIAGRALEIDEIAIDIADAGLGHPISSCLLPGRYGGGGNYLFSMRLHASCLSRGVRSTPLANYLPKSFGRRSHRMRFARSTGARSGAARIG